MTRSVQTAASRGTSTYTNCFYYCCCSCGVVNTIKETNDGWFDGWFRVATVLGDEKTWVPFALRVATAQAVGVLLTVVYYLLRCCCVPLRRGSENSEHSPGSDDESHTFAESSRSKASSQQQQEEEEEEQLP